MRALFCQSCATCSRRPTDDRELRKDTRMRFYAVLLLWGARAESRAQLGAREAH